MQATTQVAHRVRSDSVFYTSMAAAMAVVVLIGFGPTFYLKPLLGAPPLNSLRIMHGMVFSAWIVTLIAQTTLMAINRRDLHRSLGLLGATFATLMVMLGVTLAVEALRAGSAPAGAPSAAAFFAVPVFSMLAFGALVFAGVARRNRAADHKRFMILATVSILSAAFARFPLAFVAHNGPPAFFALTDLFIVPCVAYDMAKLGRVHAATLWGAGIIVGTQILSLAIGGTAAWLAAANWVAG